MMVRGETVGVTVICAGYKDYHATAECPSGKLYASGRSTANALNEIGKKIKKAHPEVTHIISDGFEMRLG